MRDFLYFFCGQSDQKSDVIRLYFCFMCRAVAPDLSAFFAAVYNHISFFGVRFCFDRAHNAAAGIGSVTGVDIHVKGTQTSRTMVARAVTERLHLQTAVSAYKRIVVFGKPFLLHKTSACFSDEVLMLIG